MANAGPDQTVFVTQMVELDGSGSDDVDGDSLTFSWSFTFIPNGSNAAISDPTAIRPSFVVDLPGIYVVQLIVNDGILDSAPDTVVITTANSRPVANAGTDQTVYIGEKVQLDGSASDDADKDPLTFFWSITGKPDNSIVILDLPDSVNPAFFPDIEGLYLIQLIVNDGTVNSNPDTATITAIPKMVTVPNVVGMSQADAQSSIIVFNLTVGTITMVNSATVPMGHVISQDPIAGTSLAEGSAVNLVISLGPVMVNVPNVVGLAQAAAESAITAINLAVGIITTANSNTIPVGNVISQNPAGGASVAEGTSIDLVISLGPLGPPLPPDPATVAPPVDQTVATSVFSATEFLYTGNNPIQTGVATGTIELKRAAVLRGKVMDRDGNPLPGVTTTILNHPEFGQTLTRTDGMFDMAVNGGGYLTAALCLLLR
jgi:hypothetical protein